jgi:hypothetical protein
VRTAVEGQIANIGRMGEFMEIGKILQIFKIKPGKGMLTGNICTEVISVLSSKAIEEGVLVE